MFKSRNWKIASVCAFIFILGGILMLGLSGCQESGPVAILFGSDAHVDVTDMDSSSMLRKVVKHAYEKEPELDAMVMVGDLVNNGTDEEYSTLMSILKDIKKDDTKFTACMGNHEWYKYGWGVNVLANAGMSEEMQSMFESYTKCGIKSDIKVKGIHIISVSPDNEMDVYHTREAYARKQIEAAAKEDPDKPIFFVAHKNVDHTVISTWNGADDSITGLAPDWSDEFKAFLAQYPQLIYISGHTHNSIKDSRSIYQEAYTHVNDGCMRYGEYLMVNISTDNVVTIHRMDAQNDQEIGDPWVIDIKAVKESKDNFKYGAARYEASAQLNFSQDAELSIDQITPNSVTVTFPTASGKDEVDCDYVMSYIFTITDKETGEKIDPNGTDDEWPEGHIRVWFDDYYGVFESNTRVFEGLSPNTSYTIEVYAINALDKPGNTIRTEFTTPAE